MGKRALLLLFCLLFVVPLVSCQKAVCPQLDIGEGLYETERVAKITNLVEGERAYFTLDGSEPGMDSTSYREDAGIPLLEGENQVKVVKYSAKDKPGPVLTAIYTIMPQLPLLATPDGVYNGVFNARITNLKEGFKAYYTLDGSEPDTASPVYTAAGIPLAEGENRVKVVKYDGAGNHSAVLNACITIIPYEPDYSNSFTRLQKIGDSLYYVQSVFKEVNFYSPEHFSKLCRYDLAKGTSEVVLDKKLDDFIISQEGSPRDVYCQYDALWDGASRYQWFRADLNGKNYKMLLDSVVEAPMAGLAFGFTGIMIDDWIYYNCVFEDDWHIFRFNTASLEKESISPGGGISPILVGRDIYYWGPGNSLYRYSADRAENTLISKVNGFNLKVFGSFIFYYSQDQKMGTYRMNLDGSDVHTYPQIASDEFVVVGDRIYYSSPGGMCSIRVDGEDQQEICSIRPQNLQYYRGKLYFGGEYDPECGWPFFCLDLATNEVKTIFPDSRGFLYFIEGEVYYVYPQVLKREAGLYHLTEAGLEKLAGE